MHGKYIYQSAILQSQFIKSFACYAANPFYAAGSGESTESEEEDFVFHEPGCRLLVTGCWLLVFHLTHQQSFRLKGFDHLSFRSNRSVDRRRRLRAKLEKKVDYNILTKGEVKLH